MNIDLAGGWGTALLWVAIAVVAAVVSTIVIWAVRRLKARSKTRLTIQQEELTPDNVEKKLADAGYAYDREQNIYYSIVNPWQRTMGYCSLYDEWATPVGMVFDCEPIRFEYGGKRWLIEFWKGQYGITVGGEIGIYNTTEPDIDISGVFQGTFYHCAADDEMLHMSLTLTRVEDKLFRRKDLHWWLTGFVLGEYADPAALTMEASLTFAESQMQDTFCAAIRGVGYGDDRLRQDGNTVFVTFTTPYSKQPKTRHGLISMITMWRTRLLVAEYRRLTEGLTYLPQILTRLREKSPALYELALHIGRQGEMFRYWETIRDYLN